MNNDASKPQPLPAQGGSDPRLQLWPELLRELSELHARLEYLRLLLRLGVRQP